jgi:hypothetical protein
VSYLIAILTVFLLPNFLIGQHIVSGEYESGLKIAVDSSTRKLTGYFESYTGWDETIKRPRFSCVFYIEGIITGNTIEITTYHPSDKKDGTVKGTLNITSSQTFTIKLSEEHGGCWNVQSFKDAPVKFMLNKPLPCIQIRYVTAARAYFYSDKRLDKKLKAYVVKNDFVCVEKIEDGWILCSYYGKRETKGWIRLSDVNN